MKTKKLYFMVFILFPFSLFARGDLDFYAPYIYCDSIINPCIYNSYFANQSKYKSVILFMSSSKLDSLLKDEKEYRIQFYFENEKKNVSNCKLLHDSIITNNIGKYALQDINKIEFSRKRNALEYPLYFIGSFVLGAFISGTWEGLDCLFYNHKYHYKTVLGFSAAISIVSGIAFSSSQNGIEVRFIK